MPETTTPNWQSIGQPVSNGDKTAVEVYDGTHGTFTDDPLEPAGGGMNTRLDPSPFTIKGNTK